MIYIIELCVSNNNMYFSLYIHTQKREREREKKRIFFRNHSRIRLIKYF